MEVHRVAVISDTHGILRREVEEQLRTCETILHAGDIDTPEILNRLKGIGPTYAVRGNADRICWAGELPQELEMELFGFRIYMIHNKKQIHRELSEFDMVICGHSHKYQEMAGGRTLYLNPGGCGRKRFRLPLTMMILTLYPAEHRIEVHRVDFAQGAAATAEGATVTDLSEQDMYKLVKAVMKEVDAGRSITEIAARHHADEVLIGQICRMYVTHPGVDVDGIMDRIERKDL